LRFCARVGAAKETTMSRRSETRKRMIDSFQRVCARIVLEKKVFGVWRGGLPWS
jgi:hypothetical protein